MASNVVSSVLISKRCLALLSSSLSGPAQFEAGWAISRREIHNNASSVASNLGLYNSTAGDKSGLAQAEPFNHGATAGMATGMTWSMNHPDINGPENKMSFSFPAAPIKLNSTRGAKTMADSHSAYSPMNKTKYTEFASSYCAAPESCISEMGKSIMADVKPSSASSAKGGSHLRCGRGSARGVSVVVMDSRAVMRSLVNVDRSSATWTDVDCHDNSVAAQPVMDKLWAAKTMGSNKNVQNKHAGSPEEDNLCAY
eukprot:gene32294-16861_t